MRFTSKQLKDLENSPRAHSSENKSFGLSDLKPEFHAKLDGLRQYMGEVLSNPHKFGGRNIAGGTMLQPLMKTLCAAVSDSKTVKPIRWVRCPTDQYFLSNT